MSAITTSEYGIIEIRENSAKINGIWYSFDANAPSFPGDTLPWLRETVGASIADQLRRARK